METTPATSRLRKGTGHTKGCSGSEYATCAGSTTAPFADGFLRHRFLPLFQVQDQLLPPQAETERSLINSLSHLSAFTGMDLPVNANLNFPFNILRAMHEAKHTLRQQDKGALHIVQKSKKALFALRQVCDTGTNLYYLPIKPLLTLQRGEENPQAASLLLSVFAYCYQIARVPYYRQPHSYVSWQYEMLREWTEDGSSEDDEQDQQQQRSQLAAAASDGDEMETLLSDPALLSALEKKLQQTNPIDDFSRQCKALALRTFEIWQRFPEKHLFCSDGSPISEDEEGVIRLEQYVSFVYDNNDWLAHSLQECVNNELNECGIIEEPTNVILFDRKRSSIANALEYFDLLFDLLLDLRNFLNDMP